MKPAEHIRKPFFKRDPFTTIAATILVFIFSQLIAAILIGTYPLIKDWSEVEGTLWLKESSSAQFIYILLAEIFAVGMIYYLIKWARVTKARIGLINPKIKDAGYAMVAYGVYFLIYLVVLVVASSLIPSLDLEQEQQVGFENAFTSAELLMSFISLVILPPLAEEIIFRGFLFTSLRAKYRLRTSIIITSILFGLAHLQFGAGAPLLWVAALDTFILSCILCYLRETSGSLWQPIFLHAIKNGVAFYLLFGSRIL
jgi:membrane protease YdiL (CAAX protease family)